MEINTSGGVYKSLLLFFGFFFFGIVNYAMVNILIYKKMDFISSAVNS